LAREWELTPDERDSKVRYNEGIGYMVQLFLENSTEDKADLLDLVISELDIVVKGQQDDEEKVFQTFTKTTLPTVYRITLSHLVAYQQTIATDKDNALPVLTTSIAHFSTLISYIKVVNSRTILKSALVSGQKFLDNFLSLGLPLLGDMIASNYIDVQVVGK